MRDLLLPRIADGDPSAVPACLSRYGRLVWTLAQRRLGNRADTEDAVQEIFIDLWRHANRFDPRLSDETTFVAMVARRRLIDRLRRRSRLPVTSPLDDGVVDGRATACESERVGRELDLGDEARIAREHFDRLRPDEQLVLRLAIYDSLPHAMIAEQTGLPLGTVKSHIRRGMDSLRRALVARLGRCRDGVVSRRAGGGGGR